MSVIVKTLGTEKLKVNLLASGDIHSITYDNFNVSLYRATSLAGGIANIFLRINDNGRIAHTPLIGAVSPATAEVNENGVIYKGVFDGVEYEARLDVGATMWFWTVTAKRRAFRPYGRTVLRTGRRAVRSKHESKPMWRKVP